MAATAFHDILELGVKEGASDWHIREGSNVWIRVSGQLLEVEGFQIDADFMARVVPEMCTPEQVEVFRQHGDVDFAHVEDGVGRFRGNLHRQRARTSLTFRHVKPQVPEFGDLGLPEIVQDIAGQHRGIVLVTGATGSGKSTTLGAMLEYMNNHKERHIITIEDPIEFDFKDKNCIFEQREVGHDTSSFASALKHALRQDPDVIVVGEMRDSESFDTAMVAADTGHLVLSTLHTTNASQAIMRILDFYEEGERDSVRRALATNLRAIISQRLVPRNGGGVVPAIEVMVNTPIVKRLLWDGRLEKLPQAIETGEHDGMMTFNHSLLGLVQGGLVSEQNGLDASTRPEQLKMNLKGVFLSSGGIVG